MTIENILQLCGLAHIGLVIGSSALPKLLDWKARVIAALVLPLPLLFHAHFLREVVWEIVRLST